MRARYPYATTTATEMATCFHATGKNQEAHQLSFKGIFKAIRMTCQIFTRFLIENPGRLVDMHECNLQSWIVPSQE